MSMVHVMHPVTASSVEALLADPELIRPFLSIPQPGTPLKLGSFLARFLPGQKRPEGSAEIEPVLPATLESDRDREPFSLDTMWHGLHFLFTGSDWEGSWPASFLVDGGTPVGEIDVTGYGPAFAYTTGEVEEIHAFVKSLKEDTLRARFQPAEMDELDIYPTGWEEDPDDRLANIVHYYSLLKQFIEERCKQQDGMLRYLG